MMTIYSDHPEEPHCDEREQQGGQDPAATSGNADNTLGLLARALTAMSDLIPHGCFGVGPSREE